PVEPRTERILSDALQELMPRCDAVIVSDYGYGVLTPCVVDLMQQLQAKRPRTLIVDSKRQLSLFQRVGATAVKPNYAEVARLLGLETSDRLHARAEQISNHGDHVLKLTGARIAAVTLDSEGALFLEKGCPPYRTYATPACNGRSAGAGDTFVAALALAFA